MKDNIPYVSVFVFVVVVFNLHSAWENNTFCLKVKTPSRTICHASVFNLFSVEVFVEVVYLAIYAMKEAGAGEWGENVRVRFVRIYFIFIVTLDVPSRAHVSKEHFHFDALCIDK